MIFFCDNRVDYMVYTQQAMNSLLGRRKRHPPHYPRIHVISIPEDSLDNLPKPEFQP